MKYNVFYLCEEPGEVAKQLNEQFANGYKLVTIYVLEPGISPIAICEKVNA